MDEGHTGMVDKQPNWAIRCGTPRSLLNFENTSYVLLKWYVFLWVFVHRPHSSLEAIQPIRLHHFLNSIKPNCNGPCYWGDWYFTNQGDLWTCCYLVYLVEEILTYLEIHHLPVAGPYSSQNSAQTIMVKSRLEIKNKGSKVDLGNLSRRRPYVLRLA